MAGETLLYLSREIEVRVQGEVDWRRLGRVESSELNHKLVVFCQYVRHFDMNLPRVTLVTVIADMRQDEMLGRGLVYRPHDLHNNNNSLVCLLNTCSVTMAALRTVSS